MTAEWEPGDPLYGGRGPMGPVGLYSIKRLEYDQDRLTVDAASWPDPLPADDLDLADKVLSRRRR